MEIVEMDFSQQTAEYEDDSYQAAQDIFSWNDPSGILPNLVMDINLLTDETYYDLVYAAATNPDGDARAAGFAEAQKVLMDTLGLIPFMRRNSLLVSGAGVSGGYFARFGYNRLDDAAFAA